MLILPNNVLQLARQEEKQRRMKNVLKERNSMSPCFLTEEMPENATNTARERGKAPLKDTKAMSPRLRNVNFIHQVMEKR